VGHRPAVPDHAPAPPDREPVRRASLVDITCDSDGKITNFACHRKAGGTLPVHPPRRQAYYLGFFLMGAYQATMGDIHNLFGRVNESTSSRTPTSPRDTTSRRRSAAEHPRRALRHPYSEFELVKMVKEAADAAGQGRRAEAERGRRARRQVRGGSRRVTPTWPPARGRREPAAPPRLRRVPDRGALRASRAGSQRSRGPQRPRGGSRREARRSRRPG